MSDPSSPGSEIETIAGLRELYRAAEARAARLRLLSMTGSALANASPDNLDMVVRECVTRLAYFVGGRRAEVALGDQGAGIPIRAPGPTRRVVARIEVDGLASIDAIPDSEDREAVRLHCEMLGATIDRMERESERTRLLATLQDRERNLETLVGGIFQAQEDERRRVSQELHDGVAQTAIALARMLEGGTAPGANDLTAIERARLARIARDLVGELRSVIGGLRPTLLDDLGLEAALQALVDGLAEDGFDARLTSGGGAGRLPAHVETALFRVGQEAIANVRKHAGDPCAVEVDLMLGRAAPRRYLRVRDHGAGVRPDALPRSLGGGIHVGIDIMRERMAAVGGWLEWEACQSGGIAVTAWLPEES